MEFQKRQFPRLGKRPMAFVVVAVLASLMLVGGRARAGEADTRHQGTRQDRGHREGRRDQGSWRQRPSQGPRWQGSALRRARRRPLECR